MLKERMRAKERKKEKAKACDREAVRERETGADEVLRSRETNAFEFHLERAEIWKQRWTSNTFFGTQCFNQTFPLSSMIGHG